MCERPLRPHFAEPLRAAHPESRLGCMGITSETKVKFQLKVESGRTFAERNCPTERRPSARRNVRA
jgi:hypothetical protein